MKRKNFTLEEKFKLLTGKNFWHTETLGGKVPEIIMNDGPHGLRKVTLTQLGDGMFEANETIPAVAYPCLSIVSCSWDKSLVAMMADYIADECIENNTDILLAPGVNIKRSPLCGRNFEYFSEDTYLSGELAYEYIKALQDRGVGACLKHFAVNNTENYRHYQNVEIDDRLLREVYLSQFKRALEAKPWTVMCSYNMVNGAYASENKVLLNDILREEMKFDGLIVSDWDAVKNRAKALKATLDLEMPYNENAINELQEAYLNGYISDEEVDNSVDRILNLTEKIEQAKKDRKVIYTKEQRFEKAQEIEEESIVLLKNEKNILPIRKKSKIDVFFNKLSTRYAGGGSSKVLANENVKSLSEALNCENFDATVYTPILYTDDVYGDYQIICAGAEYESESHDRQNINLQTVHENLFYDSDKMILDCAARNENTIVILYAGSVVDCSKWIDKVKAVLYVGFGGQRVNEAVVKVLSGEKSPSGKLTETFAVTLNDYGQDFSSERDKALIYKERFDVGYKYFDKYDVKPQFAFGYGLSYAEFKYSNLQVKKLDELSYSVSYDITNLSKIDAKEVSQLYIKDVTSTCQREDKQLKGFSKDLIKAGETKRINIQINRSAFAIYNPAIKEYYVENGKYIIYVGSSSRDLHLMKEIVIKLPNYTQLTQAKKRNYY